jgi:hypothetical protein
VRNRELVTELGIRLHCTINSSHQNDSWMYCIWTIEEPCNLFVMRLVVSTGRTPRIN